MGPVVHVFVPEATPDAPVEVLQVICEIPAASWAVPLTTMDGADVATIVMGGERMVMDGGAPLGLGFAGGLGLGLLGGLGFP